LNDTPNMPAETHQSMLRRGASNGLSLQAYEVASMDKTKSVMSGLVAIAFILFLGLALWLH
jgi:hypothetical protein